MPTMPKPTDRKKDLAAIRKLVNDHLPAGYEEVTSGKMISWQVPKAVLAETYNGQPYPYVVLAAQKNYMALYMCGVYADPKLRKSFEAAFKKTGKKLDMGKACLRFASADALPLELVGETIAKVSVADFVAGHNKTHAGRKLKKIP
jgi:Domain of unknown function (DU1801)